ncbi:CobD/CbiB family cobalamin biosynthesis protein [Sphingomonas sp. BK345]|uniref:cobalamin biosynthesis protein CobD/CbiB n=1 Tax=Sphingomonas sp. BK345 TaxID=2586980 RepID=UPI0016106A00|nr:CobD/CbiB family cobalamin biosynthesis protein [Sphingomonas sp. BK345]MBB3473104.1 adenosylcobinamide-phosphate synthase [Sphingomonas sp. BK345]
MSYATSIEVTAIPYEPRTFTQLGPGLRRCNAGREGRDQVTPVVDRRTETKSYYPTEEPDHLTSAQRRRRRLLGAVTLVAGVALAAGTAWLAERGLRATFGAPAWLAVALLAWPGLAQRSLDDHVRPVAAALERGDLAAARAAVGRIVGRDTAALDRAGVARAAVESLAESFCDAVAAPLFWLLLLGPAGLWGYKAINTADSLIGHREPRWRAFGWAAARTDDLANWLPARWGGALLCVAGAGGWRVLWRDSRRHASPNAGWTEAAMAGVLGVRLAGPVAYDGAVADKPWIGDGRADLDARDLRRALVVYRRGCLLLWCLAGAVAWAR